MTCHVLHAGDGYQYLTEQVASGDMQRQPSDELTAYYQQHGNPPGRWVGRGCAELGVTGEVSEAQMQALFGEGLHPNADARIAARIADGDDIQPAINAERLGRRFAQYDKHVPLAVELRAAYRRFEESNERRPTVSERRALKEQTAYALLVAENPQRPEPTQAQVRTYVRDELGRARQPVAGFDLVFTPVKGVSLLWGLGGHELRTRVERIHEQGWREALEFIEQEGAFTRAGTDGVAQLSTHGLVATAYQHRDSRAGDPNLHTHVTVSNRVLGQDGAWRTLDSRQLHHIAVTASEVYNSRIEELSTRELGVRFENVSKGDKRPVREVAGLPQEWLRGFSRRREQIEASYDELVADYTRQYGRTPPRSVQMQLAQQATLETRPSKNSLPSMAELIEQWHDRAGQLRPDLDIGDALADALHQEPDPEATHVADLDATEVAEQVVTTVSSTRATWTQYHLRAEAERQLRGYQLDSPQQLHDLIAQVTTHARDHASLSLDVEPDPAPERLQRPDGASQFRRHGMGLLTSEAVLAAEDRLVQTGLTARGPTVDAPVRADALHDLGRRTGVVLNEGQRSLVEHFTACGQALAVGIGPPGTGKSTAMRAVREVWETTGSRVLGLAPSAAAADVLGDEIGTRAETLHRLTHQWRTSGAVDVRPGDMLLVDEAGMAGTGQLDQVRDIAEQHGAILRLVGDHRQLTAPESGGALRLLYTDLGGVELSEIHRFHDPDEAHAVRQVRLGETAVMDWYAEHDRLHGGVRPAVLDELYRDWQADRADGATTIMISDSADVVRELGARAQTELRAAGAVEHGGVALHDDTQAGVGDQIVTRRNRRTLAVNHGRDYVKNGDLWRVQARDEHGRLQVRHCEHGGTTWLPADYVASYVELGYASTIHRAQGMTVDRARVHLSPTASRQAATVGLSRGRQANHAYLETESTLDSDEPQVMDGDLYYGYRTRTTEAEQLAAVLRRDGAELSATEQLRDAQQAPYRIDTLVAEYRYARELHRGHDAEAQAEHWVQQAVPDRAEQILCEQAWPALQAVLHELRDTGTDPVPLLAARAADREMDSARSVAEVLHYRVTAEMLDPVPTPSRPAQLPGWIPSPPEPDEDAGGSSAEAELGDWVRARAHAIVDRVAWLGQQAGQHQPPWTRVLGQVPEDPIERDQWQLRAGQVAAYREAFGIPDTEASLLGPTGRGRQQRAQEWVQRYLEIPDPRTNSPVAEPADDDPATEATTDAEAALSPAAADQVLAAAHQWAAADRAGPTANTASSARIPAPCLDPQIDRSAGVNAAAATYYAKQLEAHPHAQDYLAERVPDAVAARARFDIGYAPNSWRGLTEHLRAQGYADQDLIDAGVATISRNGGLIDRFRDRLMLIWHDEHGRVAGFTGRDLSGQHPAKYLNTPATPLFDKSELVFGLHEQRQALAAGATPVVVEGAIDVLALSSADPQRGDIAPVTASGTAITDRHLDTLQRTATSEQLVIGLDQDAAGQAAAARTAERAVQRWPDTRMATLPEGSDPADWVASHDQPAAALLPYTDRQQHQPAATWMAHHAIDSYFAAARPEHQHEVEGQMGAARAAAAALTHTARAEAIHASLDVAQRLDLVETSHMAHMLAEARSQADTAHPTSPQKPQQQTAATDPAPSTASRTEPDRGTTHHNQEHGMSTLAQRARALREQAAHRAAASTSHQTSHPGHSPTTRQNERHQHEQQQLQAERDEQRQREQQRRAEQDRHRQEQRERQIEQQRQAEQQRGMGIED